MVIGQGMLYPLQTLKPIATQLRSRMQSDTNDDAAGGKNGTCHLVVPLNAITLAQ